MASSAASTFIDAFNAEYLTKHKTYEDEFWATKMNLEGNSTEALTRSFNALESFMGDAEALEKTRRLLESNEATSEERVVLEQIEKTLRCYIVESDEATFFPGRQARVARGGKDVGVLGIVHPDVLEKFDIVNPCSILELDLEPLLDVEGSA